MLDSVEAGLRGDARGSVVTSIKVAGSLPDEVIGFLHLTNISSHTIHQEYTQPLTERSTKDLPWGKQRPARKADKLTAICEPSV
jgi:hypothetical protein